MKNIKIGEIYLYNLGCNFYCRILSQIDEVTYFGICRNEHSSNYFFMKISINDIKEIPANVKIGFPPTKFRLKFYEGNFDKCVNSEENDKFDVSLSKDDCFEFYSKIGSYFLYKKSYQKLFGKHFHAYAIGDYFTFYFNNENIKCKIVDFDSNKEQYKIIFNIDNIFYYSYIDEYFLEPIKLRNSSKKIENINLNEISYFPIGDYKNEIMRFYLAGFINEKDLTLLNEINDNDLLNNILTFPVGSIITNTDNKYIVKEHLSDSFIAVDLKNKKENIFEYNEVTNVRVTINSNYFHYVYLENIPKFILEDLMFRYEMPQITRVKNKSFGECAVGKTFEFEDGCHFHTFHIFKYDKKNDRYFGCCEEINGFGKAWQYFKKKDLKYELKDYDFKFANINILDVFDPEIYLKLVTERKRKLIINEKRIYSSRRDIYSKLVSYNKWKKAQRTGFGKDYHYFEDGDYASFFLDDSFVTCKILNYSKSKSLYKIVFKINKTFYWSYIKEEFLDVSCCSLQDFDVTENIKCDYLNIDSFYNLIQRFYRLGFLNKKDVEKLNNLKKENLLYKFINFPIGSCFNFKNKKYLVLEHFKRGIKAVDVLTDKKAFFKYECLENKNLYILSELPSNLVKVLSNHIYDIYKNF